MLLALTVVSGLPDSALLWLSVVGGLVVIWFGVQAMREVRTAIHGAASELVRRSLWRGS